MSDFQYGDAHPQATSFGARLSRAPLARAMRCSQVLLQVQELLYRDAAGYHAAVALFNAHLPHIRASWGWAAARRQHDRTARLLCISLALFMPDLLHQHLTPTEMIEWFDTAAEAARNEGDSNSEAVACGWVGVGRLAAGDPAAAVVIFESQLAFARRTGNREMQGHALNWLGNAHADLAGSQAAIPHYTEAVAVFSEVGHVVAEAYSLARLAQAHHQIGDVASAVPLFERSLELYRKSGHAAGEAEIRGRLGLTQVDLGHPQIALVLARHQLAFAVQTGNSDAQMFAHVTLSDAHIQLGDAAAAIEHLRTALTLIADALDPKIRITLLSQVGYAFGQLGDCTTALDLVQRAWNAAQESGNAAVLACTGHNLGMVYIATRDFQSAVTVFTEALASAEAVKDHHQTSRILSDLSMALLNLGAAQAAREHLQRGLTLAQHLGDRRTEGFTCFNLGIALELLGEFDDAVTKLEHAARLLEDVADPVAKKVHLRLARLLTNRGQDCTANGNSFTAIGLLERGHDAAVRAGDKRQQMRTGWRLACAFTSLGDRRALTFLNDALAIARELEDRDFEGILLSDLGYALLNSGNADAARGVLAQALAILKEGSDRRIEGYASLNLALALEAVGHLADAIPHFQYAARLLDEVGDPNAAQARSKLAAWCG